MYQTFEHTTSGNHAASRINDLRKAMKSEGLDWYLVPHADEHQNEYLPLRAERLSWLTGFTGSAGFSIIGLEEAFIFVDGRYTTQVKEQVDLTVLTPKDLIADQPSKFIQTIAKENQTIGFDPALITISQQKAWAKASTATNCQLKPVKNLVDKIWHDQPPAPLGKVFLHDTKYAGEEVSDKINRLKKIIKSDGADLLLLTDPASLAWLFNLRGNDVTHNPLALGFSIVFAAKDSKPLLFMDSQKLDSDITKALEVYCELKQPNEFLNKLATYASNQKVHCDPNLVSTALADEITKVSGTIIKKRDPIVLLRAIKNEIELDGARKAHIYDGVACSKFLCWLDNQEAGTISEIDAAKQLEDYRRKTALQFGSELKEISFDTISGAGSNGAIVHYRVDENSNAILEKDSLYLVDSGGQYLDGTTDITRTIAIGTPPSEAIENFTLVLKGHIAIACARFPQGTRGVDLDVLARNALWQFGRDYAHGTGHGVGSFLNVHEGPQSISKRGMEPFKAGMITSNEPGFYEEGAYGIRIENLVIALDGDQIEDNNDMMGFETITLCPIDLRLIDPSLLASSEIEWLNSYHKRVRKTLLPHMEGDEIKWLEEATRQI